LVSMVAVEDDTAIFRIPAGSKVLLQLVRESGQVDTVSDHIVRLDNGHEPSRVVGLEPDYKMGGFPIEMFQYVTEIQIFTF
jgi:hypothetical protein